MGPPRLTLVPKEGVRVPQRDAPGHDVPPPLADPEAGVAPAADTESVTATDMAHVAGNEPSVAGEMAERSEADETDPVSMLAAQDRREKLRIVEAILFAAPEPMSEEQIALSLIEGENVAALLSDLQEIYATRGVNLVKVAGKWAFRTADDLAYLLQRYAREERRLSKAALETLAIIAYHQPVTRAEIEEIRGVSTSAGTIDILLETGWIRPRGRRRAPGRPVTYGTTQDFLAHFGIDTIKDLPGLAELKGAGLLDATLPPGFTVPEPRDVAALMPDELPLEDAEEDVQGALALDEQDIEDPTDAAGGETGGDAREIADGEAAADNDGSRSEQAS